MPSLYAFLKFSASTRSDCSTSALLDLSTLVASIAKRIHDVRILMAVVPQRSTAQQQVQMAHEDRTDLKVLHGLRREARTRP